MNQNHADNVIGHLGLAGFGSTLLFIDTKNPYYCIKSCVAGYQQPCFNRQKAMYLSGNSHAVDARLCTLHSRILGRPHKK